MENSKKLSALFITTIIVGIVLFQYIFTYLNVGHGILLSLGIALGVYILISVIRMGDELVKSAESLTLIPLYVLFTSSMPWFFIEQQFLLPMVYSLILALCFWHMYENNLDLLDVGLNSNKMLKYIAIGAVIAIPTGYIEYLILKPAPSFPNFAFKNLAIDIVYMTFFVGLGEELLFRGIIMNDLKRLFTWKSAILIQGFLFGVMHMTWRSVPELGFTTAAGVLLGYFYYRTGSLMGPIALHGVNNVVLVGVMPYL